MKLSSWSQNHFIILATLLSVGVLVHADLIIAARTNLGVVSAAHALAKFDEYSFERSIYWLMPIQEVHPEGDFVLVLARVLAKRGEIDRAERVVKDYLVYQESELGWDLLANLQFAQGHLDQAIRAWERAGNWFDAIDALWSRAVANWTERPSQAREDFYSVSQLAEKAGNLYWMAEGYRMACATYRIEAKWPQALEACERALQLMPNSHTALAEKGHVLIVGYGQREAGLALLHRALDLAPGNSYYAGLITQFETRR